MPATPSAPCPRHAATRPRRPGRTVGRRLLSLLGVVGAVVGLVGAALATSSGVSSLPTADPASTSAVVLEPVADASVRSNRPSTNFGTTAALYADAQPVKMAYLKFHLGSTQPTAATLDLTALSNQSTGFDVSPAASDWTETDVTYENAPAPDPVTCGSSGPMATDQPAGVAIDLTACPLSPDGNGDVTLVLSTASATSLKVGSRESGTPPTLALTPDATQIPAPTPTPTPTPTPAPGAVTKLLVFVEENHSLSEMQAGMPYAASLARQYGYATDYTAITHPSLPNYIAIASGQTYGITDDNAPSSHPLGGPSVFGQAVAAGKSARVYADAMTSDCLATNAGLYVVKHNPWPYFTDEYTACASYDVPERALGTDAAAGSLPNVGMVVPDLCNDAHDCSLSVADTWFQARMQEILAGPDWQSGHLAVVLTADEDDSSQGNKVLTVVIHPSQNGHVVSTPLTHYSLTRLYEDVAGTSYLANAASAPSMSSAFGLPMP